MELIGFVSNVHSISLVVGSEFRKTISKLVDLTSGVQLKWFFKLVQYDNGVKTFPLVVEFSDCVEIMFGKYDNCSKGLHGEYSMSDAGLSWSGDSDVDTDMVWHLVDDCDGGKIPLSFDIKERDEFLSKSVLKKYMHLIAIRGNFEFKVDRSNAAFYVLSCIVDGCTWLVCASRILGRDIWVMFLYILVLMMLLAMSIIKLVVNLLVSF